MSTDRPEYAFRRILTSDEARYWFLIGWWFGYMLAIVVILIGINIHHRDYFRTHRPGVPAEMRDLLPAPNPLPAPTPAADLNLDPA